MDRIYKTRLRNKGQITVPAEVRDLLNLSEGDDLLFYTDEEGRVVVSRAQIIPPDQAWFWSKRWQQMEREAQNDIANQRTSEHENTSSALAFLDSISPTSDAED